MPQHACWLVEMEVHMGVVKNDDDDDGDGCEGVKCDFSRDAWDYPTV